LEEVNCPLYTSNEAASVTSHVALQNPADA
jgi:hypothetical protein